LRDEACQRNSKDFINAKIALSLRIRSPLTFLTAKLLVGG
jgi:hypothetical protein